MEDINKLISTIHHKIDALILSDNIRKDKKALRDQVEKLKNMAYEIGYHEGLKQATKTRK